jgi:cobalt/nickel transport system permease protein
VSASPAAGAGRRLPRRALETTLAEVTHALDQSLFADEISRRPGLLQGVDPRAKIIATLALLLAVGLSRDLWVIAGLYVLAVILAASSLIPMGFFLKRVWIFMPFFTGVIALPALFLTPGPALVTLPFGWVITRTGALTTLFLLARVSTSVSFGILLVTTTRWNLILKGLSVLLVPEGFILILGMTYRYLYLMLHTLESMLLSRRSRVVGRLSLADERRLLAASAGALLGKSFSLSNEVYLAMQSRGFQGRTRVMDTFRMTVRDWLVLGCALAAAALAIGLGW